MIPYVRNLNIEKFDIQDTADGSFSYIVRCKNASKVEFNIYDIDNNKFQIPFTFQKGIWVLKEFSKLNPYIGKRFLTSLRKPEIYIEAYGDSEAEIKWLNYQFEYNTIKILIGLNYDPNILIPNGNIIYHDGLVCPMSSEEYNHKFNNNTCIVM